MTETTSGDLANDAAAKPYHHGDLPAALRAAAVQLVAENGPSGFSLREVARRAGVSHAAPAHHFGDTRGLLTSVATEGLNILAAALEAATDGIEDASDRMNACGKAYVRTALAHPGHFGVAFANDLCDAEDSAYLEATLRSFGVLQQAVESMRTQLNGDLDVDAMAIVCWATMQGLVDLAPTLNRFSSIVGTEHTPMDELIDWFGDSMRFGLATTKPHAESE